MALRPENPNTPSDKNAAREAAQQEVFLREVDDALREDEFMGLVRRYGKPVGAAVAAGLLGLGGFLWWQESTGSAKAEHAEQMLIALDRVDAGALDAGNKDFATLAQSGSDGSKAAAQLMQAAIAQKQGKVDVAAKGFAAVAADKDVPQAFRDLATVREVAAKFDTMKPQEVVDRLKPLAVPGNPWFGSAGEMVGMAYLEMDKPNMAGPLFAAIAKDKDTPQTLRSRARQMAGMLGVDAVDESEAGKAQ